MQLRRWAWPRCSCGREISGGRSGEQSQVNDWQSWHMFTNQGLPLHPVVCWTSDCQRRAWTPRSNITLCWVATPITPLKLISINTKTQIPSLTHTRVFKSHTDLFLSLLSIVAMLTQWKSQVGSVLPCRSQSILGCLLLVSPSRAARKHLRCL